MQLYTKGDRVVVSGGCFVTKWIGKKGIVLKVSRSYQGGYLVSVQFEGEEKPTILFQDSLTPDTKE